MLHTIRLAGTLHLVILGILHLVMLGPHVGLYVFIHRASVCTCACDKQTRVYHTLFLIFPVYPSTIVPGSTLSLILHMVNYLKVIDSNCLLHLRDVGSVGLDLIWFDSAINNIPDVAAILSIP